MAFIAGKNSGVLFGAFDLTSYFNNFSFSRDTTQYQQQCLEMTTNPILQELTHLK